MKSKLENKNICLIFLKKSKSNNIKIDWLDGLSKKFEIIPLIITTLEHEKKSNTPASKITTLELTPANWEKVIEIGINQAADRSCSYVVFIEEHVKTDSHSMELLLNKTKEKKPLIILGTEIKVSGKEDKKHSSLLFWLETGKTLKNIHSGITLIPVFQGRKIRTRFNGEALQREFLAKACWGGVKLETLPMYTRSSSQLNSKKSLLQKIEIMVVHFYLILRRLLPIPFYQLVKKPTIHWPPTLIGKVKFIWHHFLWNSQDTPEESAAAIGIGMGIGTLPFWGWHNLTAIYLAQRLHLNTVLVVFFSNWTIPPLAPLVIYADLILGKLLLKHEFGISIKLNDFSLSNWPERINEFMLGGLVIALLTGFISGFVALKVIQLWKTKRKPDTLKRKIRKNIKQ